MRLSCGCYIVPRAVLERFAADPSLPTASRKAFANTGALEHVWRKLRAAHLVASQERLALLAAPNIAAGPPSVTVFDCQGGTSEPGAPVLNPGASADATAKRTFTETTGVAKFYQDCFGRNSIDGQGMTLVSSIHYDKNYNNAFWNGTQMTYGDGDGNIFIDFTMSNDVIGHELTHGVTQYTAGLVYTNEAGALNESISDVFGSMFRQWEAGQTVAQADWLIGSGIMGPGATQRGFTCLRDMANPGAAHCMSPQPFTYANYVPQGDPHVNSGIGNYAFAKAANTIGGNSWAKAGKVWYAALTSPNTSKTMNYKKFAGLTRVAAKSLFPSDASVFAGVDGAWKAAGVN